MSEEGETPSARRRILVADDNLDAAASLGMLLELQGHEVRVVYDGLAAVEVAATFLPDIVLLDIAMPQLNGYDACGQIRAQAPDANMLIVALTGWTGDDMKRRAREAGFDFYLIKPVEVPALEKMVAGRPLKRTRIAT